MNRRRTLRRTVAITAAAVVGAIAIPSAAQGTVLSLKTFPFSVKVDAQITQTVNWKGIKPGCWAPQENLSMTYRFSYRTHPAGAASKRFTKNGAVTITPGSVGTTPYYGAPLGAVETGTPGPWELEVQYPPGCGPDPAPPVPAGVVSPSCVRIRERVSAWLVPSKINGSDGTLSLYRTKGFVLRARGAAQRPQCLRALHGVDFRSVNGAVAASGRSTFIRVPVPRLKLKLSQLGNGGRSFTQTSFISGECNEAFVTPGVGLDPGFNKLPSYPVLAIGQGGNDAPENNSCRISGTVKFTVTREGPVDARVIRF